MKTELSLSDEWETPQELFDSLCSKYNFEPIGDVCATSQNKKCNNYFAKEEDALEQGWWYTNWCNPPHSLSEEFVRKAHSSFRKEKFETMMILPANSLCTNYAEQCIEDKAEYHPINRKYCRFLYNGETKDHSRNGYFVVIWRLRNA